MYEFASIIRYEEELESDALLPRLDERGAVVLQHSELRLLDITGNGLSLYHGTLDDRDRFFHLESSDVAVTLTDRRVVVLCDSFTKGGGWRGFGLGGLAIAATANAVTMARAAVRRRGKVLAGQMWLAWVHQLAIDEWGGYGTGNAVLLAARHADGTFIMAWISLRDNCPSRDIGQQILDSALADARARRAAGDHAARPPRRDGLVIPPLTKGELTSVRIRSSVAASAETAPYRAQQMIG